MKKINWGIIGTGQMADVFASDFQYVKNARIVGVYGRDATKRETFQKKHTIEKSYSDLEGMLESKDIQVVYIATTNDSHYDIALKAIKSGKHVLLEKPFTLNSKQTEHLLQQAKNHQVFIMEALWTLFLPTIKQVLTWIESGKIGKVRQITADFSFLSSEDYNGRLYNPSLGGGSLLDVGIYPLLLFQKICGYEIESLYVTGDLSDTGVDVFTSFQMTYKNGIHTRGTSGINIEMENDAIIYGDLGYIKVPQFWMAKHAYLIKEGVVETFRDDDESMGYCHEISVVNYDIEMHHLENDTVNHQFTKELTALLDRIRGQLHVKYPAD